MRARGAGRNEHPGHRSGRAAAAAISKTRRPGPGSLVIGGLGPAVHEPHPRSPGARAWRVVSARAAWLVTGLSPSRPKPLRCQPRPVSSRCVTRQAARLLSPLRPGVPPCVFPVRRDARCDRVGSADLLQLRRDLAVIKARVIAAVAADDLELLGVAAFRPALRDAGRPPPQDHRPAMPVPPSSFMPDPSPRLRGLTTVPPLAVAHG
jgi:hypothetical protein